MKKISLSDFIEYAFIRGARSRRLKVARVMNNNGGGQPYKIFRDCAKKFFQNGQDANILEKALFSIEQTIVQDNKNKSMFENNFSAIEALLKMSPIKELKNTSYVVVPQQCRVIEFEGVPISINPDLVFYKKIKGEIFYGGIKFFISKTNALTPTWGKNISVMVQSALQQGNFNVNPELCYTIDVLSVKKYKSSSNIEKNLEEIRMECQEFMRTFQSLNNVD